VVARVVSAAVSVKKGTPRRRSNGGQGR
jgi:hypothetical protein